MKFLKPVLFFVVIVIIGVGIGWMASRRPNTLQPLSPPETTTATTKSTEASPSVPAPLRLSVQTQVTNEIPNPDMVPETTEESANPDDRISDILADEPEITNAVIKLVELYPKLSESGKLEAVEHLSNLVPDDDYAPLAKILTNGPISGPVASHLLSDLIGRPNSVKMPLMLTVARDSNHPGAKEAKDNLELIISPEEDPGDDWDKWQKAVDDYLKENPE